MLRFQEQIPERAHKVGQQLLSMLLASVSELQIATGLSEEQAGRGAQDLINAGLAASVEVGCLLPRRSSPVAHDQRARLFRGLCRAEELARARWGGEPYPLRPAQD